ncbi:competence type IV pilus minor pilin ComGE [Neobacillus drentensis]|uniref:competence type IV pilus minor pilin ComGE n=1 Tax=Neobacillus drentensis TaxID=220684 RepID=UPI002FFD8C39
MLQNNKGYFLLELLLSLSTMLMICLFLLPLLMEVRDQTSKLEVMRTAQRFMYQELNAKIIDSRSFSNYTLIQNNIEYKIIWTDTNSAGQKEVCVKVEKNSVHPEANVCGVLE